MKLLSLPKEIRPAYFLKSFGREIEDMLIVSFGACNFSCPYCKRDGQYRTPQGDIINSKDYSLEEVLSSLKVSKRVRLSGGDPSLFPCESEEIAKWVMRNHGKKVSIAHNGSSVKYMERMLPYIDYAAIDLKAADPEEFSLRAGLNSSSGEKMLRNSLRIQEILSKEKILVDVRTCVFSTTTEDDLFKLAEMISKTGDISQKFWTIRLYKPVEGISWEPLRSQTTIDYIKVVKDQFLI